jgi:protein-disulfide isomerase
MLTLVGCARLGTASVKPNPKACAELATKLCPGPGESTVFCKNTLDLLTAESCTLALTKVDVSLKKLAAKRKTCDDLTAKICAELGPDTQTCSMVKESLGDATSQRCQAMDREYPKLIAELKQQEEGNKPLTAEAQAKLTQGDLPAFGPADSKVNVVEFSDFQCPYCSRAAATVHAIREKYGSKVHFVFRQFPLSFHENAHVSAEAALAAHAQGKFWELHDKMFENQSELDRSSLETYAQQVGMDMSAFKKALDSEQYKDAVDAELALGQEVAVEGTPTLFVNGQRVSNPTSVEVVSQAIDSALSKGNGS